MIPYKATANRRREDDDDSTVTADPSLIVSSIRAPMERAMQIQ